MLDRAEGLGGRSCERSDTLLRRDEGVEERVAAREAYDEPTAGAANAADDLDDAEAQPLRVPVALAGGQRDRRRRGGAMRRKGRRGTTLTNQVHEDHSVALRVTTPNGRARRVDLQVTTP